MCLAVSATTTPGSTCHLFLVPVTLIIIDAPIIRLYSYPLPIHLSFGTAITRSTSGRLLWAFHWYQHATAHPPTTHLTCNDNNIFGWHSRLSRLGLSLQSGPLSMASTHAFIYPYISHWQFSHTPPYSCHLCYSKA